MAEQVNAELTRKKKKASREKETISQKNLRILKANVHDLVYILKAEAPSDYVLLVQDNCYSSTSASYKALTEHPEEIYDFVYARDRVNDCEGIVWCRDFHAFSREEVVDLLQGRREIRTQIPVEVAERPIAIFHHHTYWNKPYFHDQKERMEFFEFSHDKNLSYVCMRYNNAHILRLMLSRNMQEKYDCLVLTPDRFTQEDAEYFLGRTSVEHALDHVKFLRHIDLSRLKPTQVETDFLKGKSLPEKRIITIWKDQHTGRNYFEDEVTLAREVQSELAKEISDNFFYAHHGLLESIVEILTPEKDPITDPKRFDPEYHQQLLEDVAQERLFVDQYAIPSLFRSVKLETD